MKDTDIERLLRQQAPEIPVSPGLETRLRTALRQRRRRLLHPAWPALPAAALVAFMALLVRPSGPPAAEITVDFPSPPTAPPRALPSNPLGAEARALRHEAERTGRFLIDCLPSLSLAEHPGQPGPRPPR